MGLSTVFYRAPSNGVAEAVSKAPSVVLGQTLTLRAHFDAVTGYGQIACGLLRELDRRNIPCQGLPMTRPWEPAWGESAQIDPHVRPLLRDENHEGWELLLGPPKHEAHQPVCARFTMWESNRLPQGSIPLLNACRMVILPSEWGVLSADASGATCPLYKVNLPISDVFRKRRPLPQEGPLTFGLMCRRSHGGVRKGVVEACRVFQRAFPSQKDVRFKLKMYPDDSSSDVPRDSRIEVVQASFTEAQMAEWFASLHVYLSMSHAEGFGLGQAQALAVGRPVIGARAHAQAEYLNEKTAFLVDYDSVRAEKANPDQGFYQGLTFPPKEESVIETMRAIYAKPSLIEERSQAAHEMGAIFSWERFVTELLAVLKAEGFPCG